MGWSTAVFTRLKSPNFKTAPGPIWENWKRGVKWVFVSFINQWSFLKIHRAQWLGNALVVAGGSATKSSESCKVNSETEKFDCVDISPILKDYYLGVAFAVLSNFCVWNKTSTVWNRLNINKSSKRCDYMKLTRSAMFAEQNKWVTKVRLGLHKFAGSVSHPFGLNLMHWSYVSYSNDLPNQ